MASSVAKPPAHRDSVSKVAPHATAIDIAALPSIGLTLLLAAIAIILCPVIRPLSERMALTLAVLGAAAVALAGGVILAMYAALYRFPMAPRWLAGFGILAALAQMAAVTKPQFGGWVVFSLLAPLGAAQLLLIGWLLWRPGFGRAAPAAR